MKEKICKAFCDSVSIKSVPAGLAISTNIASIDGDPIGFYAVGPLEDGRYRLEDSGLLIPHLHAAGADFENNTRRETFEELLLSESASWDADTLEIISAPMTKSEVPGAALRFVSLLLRVSDMIFMTQDKAVSTFKDDASLLINERLEGKATIRDGEAISRELSDWIPDLVIDVENRESVGVFLVQTDNRILEAMILHAEAVRMNSGAKVVALLEKESSVTSKTRIKALNRLDALMVFDGDQDGAIDRMATLTIGRNPQALLH